MQDYVAPHKIIERSCSASGTSSTTSMRTASRSRRARPSPVDDLGRLRRRRCQGRRRALRDHGRRRSVRHQRHPAAGRDIHAPRDPVDEGGAPSGEPGRRRCSFPERNHAGRHRLRARGPLPVRWGPIQSATTTYARFRDFGNYAGHPRGRERALSEQRPGPLRPAREQPRLCHGGRDGASRTEQVRPGAYTVSEVAAPGTNPANYHSTVECKRGTRRTQTRLGRVYTDSIPVRRARSCTFRNVRIGAPAIAIDKIGPARATAGDTLRYTLFVSNPGDLPSPRLIRTSRIQLRRPAGRQVDSTNADTSPRTLDPGDMWTYSCSKKTTARSRLHAVGGAHRRRNG